MACWSRCEAWRIGNFSCVRCGRLGWYDTTSGVFFVRCFLCLGCEGIFLAEVFGPFNYPLYRGFIIATAVQVFLQLCGSFIESVI